MIEGREAFKEYTCTCHKCGHEYKEQMLPDVAEKLFENYDPTDYECPECKAWQDRADQFEADKALDEWMSTHVN